VTGHPHGADHVADPSPAATSPRALLLGLAPTLVVNGLLPYVLFQVLSARGVAAVQALAATSVFPLGWILIGWLRRRRLDPIGTLSLVLIAVGLVTSLITGSARLYLVRESFLSGAFGLAFLGSLLLPRPAIFWLGGSIATGGDPARTAWWNGLWQYEPFRRGMRRMTAVWGLGLTAEASVRVTLAMTAPPATALAVSPVLAVGTTGLLIVWTFRSGARMRRRGEEAAAARSRA
jgi:hypothetical protein